MNFQMLEVKIRDAYEQGTTMEQAEKLAAEFLYVQVQLIDEIRHAGLDARMHKAGVKAIRAATYLKAAKEGDKKPSDVMLGAIVDVDDVVREEVESLDEAEVNLQHLENLLNICQNAHIYFRGIAKGGFGG